MEYSTIQFKKEGEIGYIFLNRPKQLNAINKKMIDELYYLIDEEIENDEDLGAIIITGNEKIFCAGADITEVTKVSSVKNAYYFSKQYQKIFNKVEDISKIVIAAISGYAVGGGCELALSCDWRVLSETARMGLAEINIGALPGGGGTQKLPRLIGIAKAKELLYTGEAISASEALKFGLANTVVPVDKLLDEAKKIAEKLLKNSKIALRFIKQTVNSGMNMNLESALEWEAQCFAGLSTTHDFREGTAAFLEKRKPQFKGR
ncbi:MAG: enoyl-CoA hydratase/isomerase family protein [Thermodesulfobacteriota bacterium]|nr:enoyl-CoA hydratase/isomerase family protein [Thermodesulfobacteriota bacterium]